MTFANKKNRDTPTSIEANKSATISQKFNLTTIFLCLLGTIQVVASYRMWGGGVVANNDFIANSSYIKIFANIFTSEGMMWSWNKLFNGGEPFLLFNLPPLTFWCGGALHLVTGLGPDTCLKLILAATLILIPFLGYWSSQPFFKDKTGCLIVAALSCLCSNEFYGLDFAFYHGMTNAFIGSIFIFFTIGLCGRYIEASNTGSHPSYYQLFICLSLAMLTHLTTLYMCFLIISCFGTAYCLSSKSREQKTNFILLVGVQILFCFIATAFWWLPSIEAIENPGFAHFWNRSPLTTLSDFFSGDLLGTSSRDGSDKSFSGINISGILFTLCTLFGLWRLARLKQHLSLCLVSLLAFLLVLGPSTIFPSVVLPFGFSLPHFRFLTLLSVVAVFACSFGLLQLKNYKYFQAITTIFFMLMTSSYLGSAKNIKVEDDYRSKKGDANRIIYWLQQNSDVGDKTYTEFIPRSADEISENYLRIRIPLETGLSEVTGWNFENSPTGKPLIASGAMWNSAVPMIEDAEKFGVRFLIVNTETAKKALRSDSRWKFKIQSGTYAVYSKRNFSRGQTNKDDHFNVVSNWTSPNRLHVTFNKNELIAPTPPFDSAPTVLKLSYSPFWQAVAGSQPIELKRDADTGYLATDWRPSGKASSQSITLIYSTRYLALPGIVLTGLTLLLLILFGLRQRNLIKLIVKNSALQSATSPSLIAGTTLLSGIMVVWTNFKTPPPNVPFDGAIQTSSPGDRLEFGTYNENYGTGFVKLNRIRWDKAEPSGTSLIPRKLKENLLPHFSIEALNPTNTLVKLSSNEVKSNSEFDIGFSLKSQLDQPKKISWVKGVTAGALIKLPNFNLDKNDAPKKQFFDVFLDKRSNEPSFDSITVEDSTTLIEGESFENDWYDSADGFYGSNPALPLSNGLALTGEIPWHGTNIQISKPIRAPKGCYDIWARRQFAKVSSSTPFVKIRPSKHYSASNSNLDPAKNLREHLQFNWTNIGQIQTKTPEFILELAIGRTRSGVAGFANQRYYLDTVALVPNKNEPACVDLDQK